MDNGSVRERNMSLFNVWFILNVKGLIDKSLNGLGRRIFLKNDIDIYIYVLFEFSLDLIYIWFKR